MAKTLAEHDYNGIDATIIADSINEFGDRITSFVCTFPRIVLAEFNTHRMFSRNSASSRAVPTVKMLEKIKNDPFIPIAWQKNHSGMQGTEYFTEQRDIDLNTNDWLVARDNAVEQAERLLAKGATKQIINRLLEPFMWHTVIVTATEYQNFFKLRCPQYEVNDPRDREVFTSHIVRSKKDAVETHKNMSQLSNIEWLQINQGGAEIHISRLAEMMWDEYNNNEPKKLSAGEWHIPFGDVFDAERIPDFGNTHYAGWLEDQKVKIATARCARVSYFNFEGKDDYEADLKLYERLLKMGHMSPFEHCAKAMDEYEYKNNVSGYIPYTDSTDAISDDGSYSLIMPLDDEVNRIVQGYSGNFKGFAQLRKSLDGEAGT